MALPSSSRTWLLQNTVSGDIDLSDSPSGTFKLRDVALPSSLPDDALLVQTLYLSNDPGQRLYISRDQFTDQASKILPLLPPGSPIRANAIARILKVGGNGKDEKFKEGDLVTGRFVWAEYAVVEKSTANVIQQLPGLSPTVYLGALGSAGLTGYFALVDKLNPKPSDTLVVSGAAGAVGNVVVQYAKKVLGVSRVVGIAGSEEKVKWLLGIGADAAVNYKSKTFSEDLKKAVPSGIDKFFDNVGGPILDEALLHANPGAVFVIVGGIAVAGDGFNTTLRNFGLIILKQIDLRGFTTAAYNSRFAEGAKALADAVQSGKIVVDSAETIVDLRGKFEEVPKVWHGLFEGKNTGKLITKLAD